MRIKTITCHEVYNYGASLQEYALLKVLENMGHDVEAIRYKPDYLSQHFNLLAISNNRYEKNFLFKYAYLLAKLPRRIYDLKRKREFDKFSLKYIKTTKKKYTTNFELKQNLPQAEAYICGSDQIWNSFFQNGKDPSFYLDFVPEGKLKISYAASFAIETLEEDIKPFVKEKVERLNKISVREASGVEILNGLGINEVVQVLDPVFLLPSTFWEGNFVENIPDNKDYIFIYDFDSNKQIEVIAKKLSKEKGCQIVTVNKNIKYADKNFYLDGPEKFLTLMYNAKYILTNSFHSVAFSLIFKKNFLVFNRSEKINTRMKDLLTSVRASNLLLKQDDFDYREIEEINYKVIDVILEEKIKMSKLFLTEGLKTIV